MKTSTPILGSSSNSIGSTN